ncbi:MAG: O-antigen ligase family protein [Ruminococcus sp.]|nr:O-antigen ligase family protein [Ruminococcus sp.]
MDKNNTTAIQNKNNLSVKETLVNYYLVLMFSVFPLFFTDEYFNIRHDKYGFFLGLSAVLIVSVGGILIYTKTVENKSPSDEIQTQSKIGQGFSIPDYAMIAFLIFSAVSTVLSSHMEDALFGTAGRNNGLVLLVFYVGIYFVITRFLNYREYIFIALAVGASAVFLLAVLNYFYIDPLGMFARLTDTRTITDFTSTIGNKNLMSSYICIILPVLIALSVLSENGNLRILYLAASGFGFMALMTSDSDSGILGLGVFGIIYFIWFVRNIERLKRYFLTATTMLAFGKLLRLISFIMNDHSKGMDQFQEFFVYSNYGYILIAICALITVLLYILDHKKPNIVLTKAVPIAITIIFAVVITGLISVMVYFSVFDTTTDLGSLETLIRFNDKWGTHRGYMWIRSMRHFGNESFIEKLFGAGPDNFYYAFSPYFQGLMQYGDGSTNAAHNEYINYLITHGIIGTVAYLTALGSIIVRAVKSAKQNPMTVICIAAVICYAVQAVVNIAQPITTPLFIIFLAMSEAFSRQTLPIKSSR